MFRSFIVDKIQWAQGEWTTLPPTWQADFWDLQHPLPSFSSFEISSASEETDEDRDVQVAHQLRVTLIPIAELHVGCIIAVRPDASYYEENPQEFVCSFWLAKIKGIKQVREVHYFKVGWFWNDHAENAQRVPQYTYFSDFTNTISYSTVLHHRIELTPQRKLTNHDLRLINRMLEE